MRADGTREAAAAVLGTWFAERGSGDGRPVDHYPAHPVDDAWQFTVPGRKYANRLWLVRGSLVIAFSPSETSFEEARLMLHEPSRRRVDGLDRPLLGRGISYPWAASGPVMAAPVVRDGRTGAYVFHGVDEESDAAGLMVQSPDSDRFGKHWFVALKAQFEAGVPAPDAVRSLLGRDGVRPDGDVGEKLIRYDGGKRELDALLNPPSS